MTDHDEEFPSVERFVDDVHAHAETGGEGVLRDELTETMMALDDAQYQLSECYVHLDDVADNRDLPDPVIEQLREAQQRVVACAEWTKEAHEAVEERREEVLGR